MRTRTLFLLIAAMLLTLPLVAQSQQQGGMSLGELARKNRSEKPKKVITNDDLPARPADGSDSSGDSQSAAPNGALVQEQSQQQDQAGAEDKGDKKDPDAKNGKKAQVSNDAYAKTKAELDALKQRESDLKRGMEEMEKNREGNEAHQKLVDETVAQQQQHLQETQKQIEQKQKELDAMAPPQQVPESKKD